MKHINQEQRDRGIIHNIMPTKRDNPCIEFVQNLQSINDKESSKELKSVLIVMGGDRFQRTFNDTYIMPIKHNNE